MSVIRHDTEIQRHKAGHEGLEQELGFEAEGLLLLVPWDGRVTENRV